MALRRFDRMLLVAARANNLARLTEALGHDANVDVRWDALHGGTTPLYEAVGAKNRKMVDLLLARGADPNLGDDNRSTPLHRAVSRQQDIFVARLLAAGADPHRLDGFGSTPLLVAADKSSVRIVTRLLAFRTKQLADVVHAAARNRNSKILALVLAQPGIEKLIDRTDANGWTPLIAAIAKRHAPNVALLVARGASLTKKSKWGAPLAYARERGTPAIVKLISRYA